MKSRKTNRCAAVRRLMAAGALVGLWIGGAGWPAAGTSAAEQAAEPSFEEQFARQLDEWLPALGAEKIPDRARARAELQKVCFAVGAPGREEDRAAVCRVMAARLAQANAAAKAWMLRELVYIGRGECVEAVAALLADKDEHVREAARMCLEHNPDPAANAALLAALPKSSGRFRIGIINSLGSRRDPASVPALLKLLGDGDRATAAAAATALGKIGGPQAVRALGDALGRSSGELQLAVANALITCADKLIDSGKKAEALAIYAKLDQARLPQFMRVAIAQGKLRAAGAKP